MEGERMCKSTSDVNDWIRNDDRNQSTEHDKKETVILTESVTAREADVPGLISSGGGGALFRNLDFTVTDTPEFETAVLLQHASPAALGQSTLVRLKPVDR